MDVHTVLRHKLRTKANEDSKNCDEESTVAQHTLYAALSREGMWVDRL